MINFAIAALVWISSSYKKLVILMKNQDWVITFPFQGLMLERYTFVKTV